MKRHFIILDVDMEDVTSLPWDEIKSKHGDVSFNEIITYAPDDDLDIRVNLSLERGVEEVG